MAARPRTRWLASESAQMKLLSRLPEIDAAQDDSGRRALELGRAVFAVGAGLDTLAQPYELRLALAGFGSDDTFQLIHGGG